MCKANINEFIPCRSCPNLTKGGPAKGFYYDEIDGMKVVKECDCHKRWVQEQKLTLELSKSNIHPDYTFDDYVGSKSLKDLNALRKVASNPEKFKYKTMIYVYGGNGCQKTSMVQALGKVLIEKGYSVMYEKMDDLINALIVGNQSFEDSTKEEKEYIVKRCTECDFLIIDESFDKKKVSLYNSGYQLPFLDNFLRSRFEISKKSIIFVSNVKQTSISTEGFGPSLQSLIVRNTMGSTLTFLDNWSDCASAPDPYSIFK